MANLHIYHFLFTAEVTSPLELDEQCGSALRGSLFESVWRRFCTNKDALTCADCPLHTLCPVSALVAPLREENPRGRDIPRPYLIVPPREGAKRYLPGEEFAFGLTLFGSIVQLLPYIMLSLQTLESVGLGRKTPDNEGKRGRFKIKQIEASHPWNDQRQVIYSAGKAHVAASTLSISSSDVQERAAALPTEHVTLDFLTPTRIIEREKALQHAEFHPLIHRLLERLTALQATYGEENPWTTEDRLRYIMLAEQVRCVNDATHWKDANSYSRRTRQLTSIGGLVGRATFVGQLEPFRELLVWGELMHIGKNCVKGNGWYRIVT